MSIIGSSGQHSLRTILILILTLAFALTACSGNDGNEPAPSEGQEVTAPPQGTASPAASPAADLPYAAPLTGIRQQEEPAGRPYAVMINNFAAARPQSGLSEADIVWEVLAEGGITRLVAIFQSKAAGDFNIGPIRSIRPYLIELGETYGAVLVHAGGSNDAYAILRGQKKAYLDEITNAGGAYWRSKERKAPHNLYSNLERLHTAADKKGYSNELPIPAYTFTDGLTPPAGVPASEVNISFLLQSYQVNYTYDSEAHLYKRSLGDQPHIDLNTGEPLTAANLVVLGANHRTLDGEGRLSVDLSSGGKAILFQLGTAVEAEWVRSPDGLIRIVKDGTELPFATGKTYYHIVPNKPTFAEHIRYGE
ncbi:DUF3048 domain-containing protein [Paenibacillus sp. GCM10023252]|uniref:DUF3048 domain-containing protein n=1 Tax=Paenibacillus sp. GCM10023252 TaxID=3252649 RepID=UPI00360E8A92